MALKTALRGLLSTSAAIILLFSLATATAIVLIALTQDVLHFARSMTVWAVTAAPYETNDKAFIFYQPDQLDKSTMRALFAAGVVGTVASAAVVFVRAARLWVCREQDDTEAGEVVTKSRTKRMLTLAALLVSAPAVLANLILIIYAAPLFHTNLDNPKVPILESRYIDPLPTGLDLDNVTISTYINPRPFNVVEWNCGLAMQIVSPSADSPVRSKCFEGIATFDMMIGLIIVQGLGLGMLGWQYWREGRADRAAAWAQEQ